MKNRETIYANVGNILLKFPTARDNNNFLWWSYANIYCKFHSINQIDELYRMMEDKTIPSFDTLTRFSRDIQMKYPLLRGEKWEERQRKQNKVKEDLGYNVKD